MQTGDPAMSRLAFLLPTVLLPLALLGCAQLPIGANAPGPAAGSAAAPQGTTTIGPLTGPTATPASFDTVSEAEKDAARQVAAAAPSGGELGTVTVALGSPAETGLWVKSALVSEDTPGTVRTSDGDAIAVTLKPLGGAGGPQISLSALQALGLPLVGLFPVTLATAG